MNSTPPPPPARPSQAPRSIRPPRGRTQARVLVIGAGGLGCPAMLALARAGVGSIAIADDDVVEESNLHRQILFDESDLGAPKAEAAAFQIERLEPSVYAYAVGSRILPHNAVQLVEKADVVVEGSDNFATKFLVADACALARVPVVHAAAVRWHGTVLAVGPAGGPCYRCVFEDLPTDNAPNCAEAGVVGPVVGILGALQADLALQILDGAPVEGTLVTFDGQTDELRRRTISSREACPLCGRGPARIDRIDPERYVGAECEERSSSQIIIENV
jgi:molybdopterin/thiamine biosynthesis adenylyltransferase